MSHHDSMNPYDPDAHERDFRQSLSAEPHIEYWTHNPWQRADSADAEATRIAEQYLERFTDALISEGYMPFVGVEVNALTHGVTAKEIVGKLHALIPAYYDAYVHRLPRMQPLVSALQNPAIWPALPDHPAQQKPQKKPSLRRFSDLSDLKAHFPSWRKKPEPITLSDDEIEAVLYIRSELTKLTHQGWLSAHDIDILGGQINWLDNQPHNKRIIDKKLAATFRHYARSFAKERLNAYDPAIGIGHNLSETNNGEVNGRIYEDMGAKELEIATRAASPLETAHSVNTIKRMLYESSHDYEDRYAKTSGLPESSHDILRDGAPRSELAGYLRNSIPTAYNISYGTPHDNCGEHISISLQRAQPNKTYENARHFHHKDNHAHSMTGFGLNNLTASEKWVYLLSDAYLQYLPHDTLLGIGNERLLNKAKAGEETSSNKHSFRHNGDRDPVLSRIEIRSFHDASSNITLSLLSIIAITYAVVREINNDPVMADIFYHNPAAITDDMVISILDRLHERYSMNSRVPSSLPEAEQRLQSFSPTLTMMEEWAHEHAKDKDTYRKMLAEIDGFEQLLIERARGFQLVPEKEYDQPKPTSTQISSPQHQGQIDSHHRQRNDNERS